MKKGSHQLTVFVLAMMNVALVMSLRGLPMMAKEGLSMIFYILFSSLLFLLPVSLVSAELASGYVEEGGIYAWVKEALGNRLGFTAIWLQWIQNTIWYPTVLAFAAAALSYLFLDPSLTENKLFNVLIILTIYWGATFVNFSGMKTASWITTAGVVLGTLLPALFLIVLGIIWITSGNRLEFMQVPHAVFPDFTQFNQLSFLGGIVLLFAGMEVGAVHVREMKDPKKNYPKAVFLSMMIIIAVFFLGSFSIACAIPADKISLTAGILQAFKDFLHLFGLDFLVPVMGFLLAFGAIGGVTAWIGGPSKGLLSTAKQGDLPPFLQYTNKNGVQTHILWIQGIIVTVLTLVFLLMPNISSAFFLLTVLTAILYLLMYILLYISAIVLRIRHPHEEHSYKIPGGILGMCIVAGIGLLAVIFAIVVSFFPPSQLEVGNPVFYSLFLLVGTILFVAFPLLLHHYKNPKWMKSNAKQGD